MAYNDAPQSVYSDKKYSATLTTKLESLRVTDSNYEAPITTDAYEDHRQNNDWGCQERVRDETGINPIKNSNYIRKKDRVYD